ncbi:MAG: hypothetical protein H8E66_11980 [Planctomycetes bacterium]|nr:hypothetical protein [Planctomycetota bacterium]
MSIVFATNRIDQEWLNEDWAKLGSVKVPRPRSSSDEGPFLRGDISGFLVNVDAAGGVQDWTFWLFGERIDHFGGGAKIDDFRMSDHAMSGEIDITHAIDDGSSRRATTLSVRAKFAASIRR